MADETPTTPAVTPENQNPGKPSDETKNAETPPAEHLIPKSRFDEVNEKLRKLEKQATDQAKAQAAAEETRLAEQKEWETLAAKRGEELEALKPKATLADELSALVTEQVSEEIKAWPDEVKAMQPQNADVLTLLAWVKSARPLAAKLSEKPTTPAYGNSRGPKAAAQAGTGQNEKEARSAHGRWTHQNL